jgi:hypothetical protein
MCQLLLKYATNLASLPSHSVHALGETQHIPHTHVTAFLVT